MDVNIENLQVKLYELLKESGWGDKLRTFIMSSDFLKILDTLVKEVEDNRRFVPEISYIFKAFEKCYYNETRVVILGQDPYPYLHVPDGLAFSCSRRPVLEASLRYMFREIGATVYKKEYEGTGDLTRWANQGVLLLNTSLTAVLHKPGLHNLMWRPFMAFLFDILGWHKPGLIYVFMGKVAQEWASSIPDNNYKIMVSHPASAAHMNSDAWDCKDCFNEVNKILVKNNDAPIAW